MKLSNSYFFTKKEDVRDEECVSANLLTRAGMIKRAGSGIYIFLPLGFKVMRKIENIIRNEMDNIGSQELVMPSLVPEEYFVQSKRRDAFGDDMFSLKDRTDRSYVLGPTHEELFADVCRDMIHSYKDMPISLYQMANKYRDEARSRYGLIRTREFVMKEAYTFDKDLNGLDKSYNLMFEAYKRIFDKLEIDYRIVKGAMGGLLSEEFQAITDIGEDTVVMCPSCNLATNIEVCECKDNSNDSNEIAKEKELLNTPNCGSINDLASNYNISPKDMCKTMIYKINGNFYAFMVRGDRDVNEYKISQLFGAKSVEMASAEEDEKITGASVGFAGPIGLKIPVIIDYEVSHMKNFLVGANRTDYHYVNANLTDFKYDKVADIRNASCDDLCPNCGSSLEFKHGIEIGNTFKLGTKYSEAMNLYYLDDKNVLQPVFMGSYVIGPARILSAIIEQRHDENGIILPKAIAPFDLEIVIIDMKDEEQVKVAGDLYQFFKEKGIDVVLDDRDVRAGVKFKDGDLIGVFQRIVVGKNAKNGIVEIKKRESNKKEELSIEELKKIL